MCRSVLAKAVDVECDCIDVASRCDSAEGGKPCTREFVQNRIPIRQPGELSFLQTANDWLRECLETHENFKGASQQTSHLGVPGKSIECAGKSPFGNAPRICGGE